MYQIKQNPEDFIVEEIPKDLTLNGGTYAYFILEKKNWNTRDALRAIANKLRVNEKYFNIAGVKDKKALTKQYVSANKVSIESLQNLKIKDLKITPLGYGKERLKLGQLLGNKFVIRVRKADEEPRKIKFIENYYDDQRFGGKNKIIGEALVKKEFRKACFSLRLRWEGKDYIGSLRKLSKNILRIYLNSYQSYLFNKAVEEYLRMKYKKYSLADYSQGTFVFSDEKIKNEKMPILGFLTEFENKEIEKIYMKLMKEDKIKKEDFIMKEMPEISSEGGERDMLAEVKYLEITEEDKATYLVSFTLPPGSYATIAIKKMFS
ncbi:tRNA pseudouridine(13) synthase TruD [Candidatus Woesearchaeota archaeon]|nr:tRNA pseudouridine(13) synthase TruD [Candidatus Woesearchaeota archaeon]